MSLTVCKIEGWVRSKTVLGLRLHFDWPFSYWELVQLVATTKKVSLLLLKRKVLACINSGFLVIVFMIAVDRFHFARVIVIAFMGHLIFS